MRELVDIQNTWEEKPAHQLIFENGCSITGESPDEIKSKVDLLCGKSVLSGCYIMLDENNVPIYVGKSVNLKLRLKIHLSESDQNTRHYIKFIKKLILICSSHEIDGLETKLIRELKPMFNGPQGNSFSKLTVGGYISFYDRLREIKGSKEVFDALVKEWTEKTFIDGGTKAEKQNSSNDDNEETKQKDGGSVLTLNLSEIVDYLSTDDLDKLVLKKVTDVVKQIMEDDDDTKIVLESLDRILDKISR